MQFRTVNNYQNDRFEFNASMENNTLLELYKIGVLDDEAKKQLSVHSVSNGRLDIGFGYDLAANIGNLEELNAYLAPDNNGNPVTLSTDQINIVKDFINKKATAEDVKKSWSNIQINGFADARQLLVD